MDHGQNQAAFVGFEQIPKVGLGVRAPDRDILLLHLAEQPLDPAFDLSFKFRSIHDHHDRRLTEPVLAFHDQARGDKERKRLTGTLRMPDKPTPFRPSQSNARQCDPPPGAGVGVTRISASPRLRRKTVSSLAEYAENRSARKRTGRQTGNSPPGALSIVP